MARAGQADSGSPELRMLRDAASELGVSFPTIKQWIYKKKIRSVQTVGGHHRIPQGEIDRLLFRTRGKTEGERKERQRRVSGRNQLVGRVEEVRISGLMAEITISIGGQIITYHLAIRARDAAQTGANCRCPDQSDRSDDSAGLTQGNISAEETI
jgi:excisionase family DNA binding protein